LHKPTDGAPRPTEPMRAARSRASLPHRLNRRSVALAWAIQAWMHGHAATPAGRLRASLASGLRSLSTAERALPVAVAAIVAVASLLALLPGTPAGAVGGVQGKGEDVRIAVNGGVNRPLTAAEAPVTLGAPGRNDGTFQPIVLPEDLAVEPTGGSEVVDNGAFLDDGTLVAGYAPETTIEDGSSTIVRYKVKSGDTLGAIAHRFGVKMLTVYWANKLESKDALHVGQVLRIPPVNGLIVTVTDLDTLESLAAKYDSDTARIMAVNGLADETLVVGQVLVVPGAKGEPIPTPKPTPKPKPKAASTHHSTRTGGSTHYTGGNFRWPVVGGGNYVSQYFHYGHYAIDIAADYGSPVVAAAGGRVTFAGWKSNGGGWQVWISHGSGLYTTYNHMSGVAVGRGQYVGRGQRVGRVGQSGNATGPHLHFEVWKGPIWDGGTRVNPMRYF